MADRSPIVLNIEWGDEEYADATIQHGTKEWLVHRVILCSKSKYFQKALGGSFMEAKDRRIDLTGLFTALEIESMLKYLYGARYSSYAEEDILPHVRMFQLGDYFQIPQLKAHALDHVKHGLTSRVMPLSAQHKLVDNPVFLVVVEELLTIEDMHPQHEVFEVVTSVCSVHLGILWRYKGFQDLFTGNKALAKAIMDKKLGYNAPEPQHTTTAFDDIRLRLYLSGENHNNPLILP